MNNLRHPSPQHHFSTCKDIISSDSTIDGRNVDILILCCHKQPFSAGTNYRFFVNATKKRPFVLPRYIQRNDKNRDYNVKSEELMYFHSRAHRVKGFGPHNLEVCLIQEL
ncbi:hypothetical protein BDQ12DRAFT_240519 [Crucibulum laeve]|uniref:Uncharacterized protein n=1 Tax=Crucibulum laeve TaxID=68775 RepID=A0A5C3LXZ3_9AGAR|nr:hypothetical protein BDQ12DRAFT_240519 [Crucibulum laeve]